MSIVLLLVSMAVLGFGIWLFNAGLRIFDNEHGFGVVLAGLCVGILGVCLTLVSAIAALTEDPCNDPYSDACIQQQYGDD